MRKEDFKPGLYSSHSIQMSFLKANLVGTLFPLPLVFVFSALFLWLNHARTGAGFSFTVDLNFLLWLFLFYVFMFLLIAMHELTHAFAFLAGCENRWKSIHFGIKSLTPYCHCEEVIPISIFRRSLLAPLWFIALPLAAAALITGSLYVFFLAVILLFGSGGDMAIFWSIRKYRDKQIRAWDIDDAVGCIIYVPLDMSSIELQNADNPRTDA